jgi:predicted phage terminase large subunit-like protein
LDIKSYSSEQKQQLRKKLARQSIENFIEIYLSHHFCYSAYEIERINNSLDSDLKKKLHDIKKLDITDIQKQIQIEYYTKLFNDAKVSLDIAGKVIFNKTSHRTFEIYQEISNNTNKWYAIAKSRGFAKTTEIFAFILYCAAFRLSNFLIYVAETLIKSKDMTVDLIEELENNELLKMDFPHLKPRKSEYTKKQVEFAKTGIVLESGFKFMPASALKSSLRGKKKGKSRPDKIIIDDIINDEHVSSVVQRKKLESWFRKQVMSLGGGTGCSIIVAGTILHYADLISKLTIKKEFDKFETALFPAIDDDGNSNWDEVWNIARLEIEKENLGAKAFSSEFLCKPLPEDDAIFTDDMIKNTEFDIKDILNRNGEIIGFLDVAQTGKGDYTSCVVNKIVDNHYYIYEAFIKKININNLLSEITDFIIKNEITVLGVESNNQEFFIDQLKEYLINKHGYFCNIISKYHTTNKQQRIASTIAPPLSIGALHFRKDRDKAYPLLMEQLFGFPVWEHDDAIDALAGNLEISKQFAIKFSRFTMS